VGGESMGIGESGGGDSGGDNVYRGSCQDH